MHKPVNYDKLLYWMSERENIRKKKDAREPKPWTTDEVFQRTYFCNVRREDDKVTRFIRRMYSPRVFHPLFVHNIILSRFLNWPDTLEYIDYLDEWDIPYLKAMLRDREAMGKLWGAAYVVTTHGLKMDKIDYLCDRVLPSIFKELGTGILVGPWEPTCAGTAKHLQKIEGISTFMAGQVVADLKNTPGFPLADAPDWWTFALPGPGSRRGMDWLHGERVTESDWFPRLQELAHHVKIDGWVICNQDLQNSLCEFDKYMRVSTGTGRSKRHYAGR